MKLEGSMFAKRDEIYLDSAATTLKLLSVIEALNSFYTHQVAPVHRSVYPSSQAATQAFEKTRDAARDLIHANDRSEIVFTKGTTEGINLIAHTFGDMVVQEGDEILLTEMEHHANIVPWKVLADRKGAHIKVVPVLENGMLDYQAFQELLSPKTKIVAVTHVSNVLGTINDVEYIYKEAQKVGASVVIDGAQAIAHVPVDVTKICDFYLFSAHKMYGPEGVGVLYGKKELLKQMPPYQTGGAMIEEVSFDTVTYQKAPWKFEAGTPSIGAVIAFQKAIEFVANLDFEKENAKHMQCIEKIKSSIPDATFYTSEKSIGILSFTLDGAHPLDVATMLGVKKVAVRSGHMCAQPLLKKLGCTSLLRVSFGAYTNHADIDRFIEALAEIRTLVTA